MKRNFLFIGIFVACIATVSAYNVMLSISKSNMQLVSLSALADSEDGGITPGKCYMSMEKIPNYELGVRLCNPLTGAQIYPCAGLTHGKNAKTKRDCYSN
jgi:hypothetical protein